MINNVTGGTLSIQLRWAVNIFFDPFFRNSPRILPSVRKGANANVTSSLLFEIIKIVKTNLTRIEFLLDITLKICEKCI